MHHTMNGIVDRFQEFAPDWAEGTKETDLVKVENIKETPMTFFIGTADAVCLPAKAEEYIPKLNNSIKTVMLEGKDHDYFYLKGND